MSSILSNIKLPASIVKSKVIFQKHAPEILVATGAILVVGSAVLACKQTLKAAEIVKKATDDLDYIKDTAEGASEEDYSAADIHNDKIVVYSNAAVGLVKCYGPSVIGGALGLGMILYSHKLLTDWNTTLTVAYTNLLNSFNNYRKQVIKRFGQDEEYLLSSGSEMKDISIRNENGEESTELVPVVHDDGSGHSPYARIFDESNNNWSRNPNSNLIFLKSQQNFCNEKLRSEGILFLNDVYKALGFPPTKEGQIVGWVFDPRKEIENHTGDDYVDFGIYDMLYKNAAQKEFLNGYEPCVWLDFNVDGVVYHLI